MHIKIYKAIYKICNIDEMLKFSNTGCRLTFYIPKFRNQVSNTFEKDRDT